MQNEEFRVKVENDKNKIPVNLLFFILIVTMILSLVVSYFIVNFSGFSDKDYSTDSGRIIVEVVDGKSNELFSMDGKIVVEVVGDNKSGDGE